MTKTRRQSLSQEEHKHEPKKDRLLHSTSNMSQTQNKITKKRTPIQEQMATAQLENADVDAAQALLTLSKPVSKKIITTSEQIEELIYYIVHDKMSVNAASQKAGMSAPTGQHYYQEYQNDPEHKIPLPRTVAPNQSIMITQKKINELIYYMVHQKMTISQAAYKVKLNLSTAARYYRKYKEDPNHKIPKLKNRRSGYTKPVTQEKITELIGYIVDDKMSVSAASAKANITREAAKMYYLNYLKDRNHQIPSTRKYKYQNKTCTNDQVKSLIGYIANDGMSLLEASVKANMGIIAAKKYYNQYLNDPEKVIPTPQSSKVHRGYRKPPPLDQVKNFFCYLLIDKLSVTQAAKKANISAASGWRYYARYLKNPTNEIETKDTSYTLAKMKRFLELVQNEKMSLKDAGEAAHLNLSSARKHYQLYLKDPKYEFPEIKNKKYTHDDFKRLIDCVEKDKMRVPAAARSISMDESTAKKYYRMYRNDPEHKIPSPLVRGYGVRQKTFDKYSKIIAEIYKENPTIKPIHEIHHAYVDSHGIDIGLDSKE